MQRWNTIMMGIVSILIIILMSVSLSPQFRHKIRQFIGDASSDYYIQTIEITNPNNSSSRIVRHSLVNLNDQFVGYSKALNKMVIIPDGNLVHQYINSKSQKCSACHDGSWQ